MSLPFSSNLTNLPSTMAPYPACAHFMAQERGCFSGLAITSFFLAQPASMRETFFQVSAESGRARARARVTRAAFFMGSSFSMLGRQRMHHRQPSERECPKSDLDVSNGEIVIYPRRDQVD